MSELSKHLFFAPETAMVPPAFSAEIYEVSLGVTDPNIARKVIEELEPVMLEFRADRNLAIAWGLLVEKQRFGKGMRALWNDLLTRFPEDLVALRMLMRWYRRDQDVSEGIERIAQLFPECCRDLSQAAKALTGLAELKAWSEIDDVMRSILELHPKDRAIRMSYIKYLSEQSLYYEAAVIAAKIEGRGQMGVASQELLKTVEAHAETMRAIGLNNANEVIGKIISLADKPKPSLSSERVVFFSGQLGTGGAERQMTRIASAYQQRHDNDEKLGIAPQVWVKHATPTSGADFYLPFLKEAGVKTRILSEEPDVKLSDLEDISDEMRGLLSLLAPDVLKHTCALVPMFRSHKTQVAYLWQDGGIVLSAIAAILAGVPRIITSFRGLPPNLRPNLFRDEQPVLFAALARLPHVTFTANSQKSATAYEKWLSLDAGTVVVVPNAIPPVLPDGDDSDYDLWSDILGKSEQCHKTVISVFRYDANKRPKDWINAAASYCQRHDDTRFVMIGGGTLQEECEKLVVELGLENRIFIAGIRNNVGFYMHRADLLMHLARMEGLPNVLIEAQLAGTPVLATPAGGTDEVVSDGVTARLLSDADILPEAELYALLNEMLTDEDGLARMGAAAKAHSGDRFSVETILGRTSDLFKQKV